jgi:phage terminase large subunit-like protein
MVKQYVDDVLSGRRVAGKLEIAAVERYQSDLKKKDSGFFFDEAQAVSACEFFELLVHTDGEYAGTPFYLYGWQVFIVWQLFGWRIRGSNLRRFRELFLTVARGNGKTPFGAALLLLIFAFDSPIEERAECYTAAVKRDQAGLSFNAAKRFVERSGLCKSGYLQALKTAINIPRNGSTLVPLSSDAKSADGLNIHGLLRDELHAWTDYQREYYEKLQTALGKRRQPLAITITTAGSENSTLWREQYEIAKKVVERGSTVDIDSLLVAIYEIDDDDDELDPAVWSKANPMLEHGVVKIKHLQDMASAAAIDSTQRHQFRRYHGNKLTYSFNKSFTAEMWERGNGRIPQAQLKSGFAGVDLGWCDDIAAIGYVFPLDYVSIEGQSKRRYAIFADAFCPRNGRRELSREPWRTWIQSGRMMVTESEWTDTAPMYEKLAKRNKDFGIKVVAYDPANAREFATNVVNELRIETFNFQQSHSKYHEPLREFKQALLEGRILHGGCPLLGWAATNVVEEENAKGHRMPSKGRSIDKIDPFVAVLMAFSEAMFADRQSRSVYRDRGVRFLEV